MRMENTQQIKSHSPWALMFRRLRRNRIAIIGGIILTVLYICAILADFLSPNPPHQQDLLNFYHPPTKIHFIDERGKFHFRPFIYRYEMVDLDRMIYKPDTQQKYYLKFFVNGYKYKLLGLIPMRVHLIGVESPAKIYIMGSDGLGRDVFARLLQGSRISLSIGLIGIFITLTLGMIIGAISGYLGGVVDNLVMRLSELILSIPGLYLIIALRATFPERLPSTQIYLLIVIILGFIYWAGAARVIRGMTLSLREQEYVLSARALGASTLRIIIRHILPNTLTYVIIAATLSVPGYILGEVYLSFLGVGIQEPQASWGNMLQQAQDIQVLTNFPWLLAPGFAIFVTVFAFNFLGDGIRDALDPRHELRR